MGLTAEQVRTDTLYQIGALSAFATAHGTRVRHVAPHGRLGNLVAVRADYAKAVCDAAQAVDPEMIVVCQDGELSEEAKRRGLPVAIVGIVGALIGGFLSSTFFDFNAGTSWIWGIVIATVGAVVLLFLLGLVKKRA